MNRKFSNITFIILVLIVLIAPVIAMNLKPNQVSTVENRTLAERPSLSQGITPFMQGVDNYIDDRIGFRDDMMHLYNRWNYTYLKGNHSKVIAGQDGWLFYKESLADYTGTNIDTAKTNRQVQILTKLNEWCKARGITFVFAIGPNKATIYDQYMPDSIHQAPTSSLDCLMNALDETDIKAFCPKNELIANRNDTELYFKQDTHWNGLGSRYLLDAMVSDLNLPSYNIPVIESHACLGDLLTMQGTGTNEYTSLYTQITRKEGSYTETISGADFTLHSPNTRSFVCYRDSFTTAMVEYYSYYFNGPIHWTYDIDLDYVNETNPQYLILSCVERYMDQAIEANADILNY